MKKFMKITTLFLLLISAGQAKADTISPGMTITGDAGIQNYWSGSIGYQFTANVNTTVNALGMYTDGQDVGSLAGPEQVGLWNSSGTLLASTTVVSGDPIVGLFQYQFISPVALTAGSSYFVAGLGAYTFNESFVTDSRITYTHSAYANDGSGLVFPGNQEDGYNGFPGGTVSLSNASAVPEPATMTLLGMGIFGLAGYRLRRRATTSGVAA